jgi:general secretion pathway protein D
VKRWSGYPAAVSAALLLCACGTTPQERAAELGREGRWSEALALLDTQPSNEKLINSRDDAERRALRARLLQTATTQWLAQAERARATGRLDDAAVLLAQVERLSPANPRAAALRRDIALAERHNQLIEQARSDVRNGRADAARTALEQVLREAPQQAAARALLHQTTPALPPEALPPALAEAYRRPVTLEFRDAPLRNVFEALARSHQLNVVFDREVRADQKVTLFLRDIALDEALRVLLSTQQLERKVLNANTLLIYPATPAKQREHQELVARTFYLTNTDTKNATALIRTITKTQDLHADERLNAIVVRESPAVMRVIEDLVAAVDLPDAEVTIDVEVLEVSSRRLDELGLQWPEQVGVSIPSVDGSFQDVVTLARDQRLRGRIANPVLLATLRGSDDNTNTLANPTIRARNREKAQVHVGEKLPVFTTTSVPNAGVAASVNYLDVGIKLDVEPTVQLDNEVVIKVTLEVSNLLRQVNGPSGSVGYELGTRRTSTTLRLKDGETQILAGLVKDDDLRNVAGIPGLAELPLVGRLFGLHSDRRDKTELVLLMTPRVVRNLPVPDPRITQRPGGTGSNPGAQPLRLSERARAAVPMAGLAAAAASAAETAAAATQPPPGRLELATSGNAGVGDAVSVSLRNRSDARINGELVFDNSLLRNAAVGADESPSAPFELAPNGQFVLVLRVLPTAAGKTTDVVATLRSAVEAGGGPAQIEITGSGRIEVKR